VPVEVGEKASNLEEPVVLWAVMFWLQGIGGQVQDADDVLEAVPSHHLKKKIM
jgi:hypothetical protein